MDYRPGASLVEVDVAVTTPTVVCPGPPNAETTRVVRCATLYYSGSSTVFEWLIRRGGSTYVVHLMTLAATAGALLAAAGDRVLVLEPGDTLEVRPQAATGGTADATVHYLDEIREEPQT